MSATQFLSDVVESLQEIFPPVLVKNIIMPCFRSVSECIYCHELCLDPYVDDLQLDLGAVWHVCGNVCLPCREIKLLPTYNISISNVDGKETYINTMGGLSLLVSDLMDPPVLEVDLTVLWCEDDDLRVMGLKDDKDEDGYDDVYDEADGPVEKPLHDEEEFDDVFVDVVGEEPVISKGLKRKRE